MSRKPISDGLAADIRVGSIVSFKELDLSDLTHLGNLKLRGSQ